MNQHIEHTTLTNLVEEAKQLCGYTNEVTHQKAVNELRVALFRTLSEDQAREYLVKEENSSEISIRLFAPLELLESFDFETLANEDDYYIFPGIENVNMYEIEMERGSIYEFLVPSKLLAFFKEKGCKIHVEGAWLQGGEVFEFHQDANGEQRVYAKIALYLEEGEFVSQGEYVMSYLQFFTNLSKIAPYEHLSFFDVQVTKVVEQIDEV